MSDNNLQDTLRWCGEFKQGMFTPAPTQDGWTVEMHGLVSSLLVDLPPLLKAARDVCDIGITLPAFQLDPEFHAALYTLAQLTPHLEE